MKILLYVDAVLGSWLALLWVYAFWWIKQGYQIGEPDLAIATTEFYFACVVAIFFVGQIVYWLIRLCKG